MKTAIITGASAGLGRIFALELEKWFEDIECVWLVARRGDRLYDLSAQISLYTEVVEADLTTRRGLDGIRTHLADENPEVVLLINCAGCGYWGAFESADMGEQRRTVDLNAAAMTEVTGMVLPYMPDGGRIINVSSIASFVPNTNMAVYSATKAYVSFFSRALGDELRGRGITVTAVCPGPMKTEFLKIGHITGNSKTFRILPYCTPEHVCAGAYNASLKRRAVYTDRKFYKIYRVLAALLPQAIMVKLART